MGFGIWSKFIYGGPLEAQQYSDSVFLKPYLEHLLHLLGRVVGYERHLRLEKADPRIISKKLLTSACVSSNMR